MRPIPGFSLWLGHAGDVRDLRGLHEAGIAAVVDLAAHEPPAILPRELVYCRFPIADGPGNPSWILRTAVDAVAGLVGAGVATLVACGAGMSRSPCVAGAAIARVRGCPANDGLRLILGSAPADVSPGLWADLLAVLG